MGRGLGVHRWLQGWGVLVSAALVACPGEPPAQPPKPVPVVTEPGPVLAPPQADGRLPHLATPIQYALDLEINPTSARFRGVVRIEVDVLQKTSFLVLHAHALEIEHARAEVGGRPMPARASMRVAQGGKAPEELVLAFDTPLAPGRTTLVLEYSGPFDDELSGLYRLKDGGLWYAFTQFEPTDARRAFPCFDEPSFKVPFDVAITVPRPMIAVANASEASREELPNNKTRFKFTRTPPLPTYLVALAVGELETKDATRFTKPPIRLVATKGKAAAMSAIALDVTSALVDALGTWLAVPYPYEKLDIVAVPDFRSGAMENPGLITFREERLLLDPARASVASRRSLALITAHELAHQWFGDFVTATWWNDLWLNEAMATWMEMRIVDRWKPGWGIRFDAVASAHGVMDLDGLVSARAVRQPVVSTSDADEAFDGITYEKGAAVLSTIERWIGEDVFQRGLRDYVKDNAWKSVDAKALLSALDRASSKDVSTMALSYLDKPGVPEVSAHLECEPGSRWHMELSSQQWRPLGSKLPEENTPSWTIPVCVRPNGEKKDMCAELVAGAPSLVAGRGCPTFVHPNAPAAYYRFALSEKDFVRLAEGRSQLDVPARVSLLSNAWAAVRSGALEPKAMLRILPPFDDDNARQVVSQLVTILGGMDETLIDEETRAAFRKFALARLTKRKKALGWGPSIAAATKDGSAKDEKGKAPETDVVGDEALMRHSVLFAMADVAEDDMTLREADEIAVKWLANPASVDGDTGAIAVEIASRKGSDARMAALLVSVRTAKNREDRLVALRALLGFDDEARLKQALDMTLTDDVRDSEMRYVVSTAFGRRKAQPIAEAWVRAHWDALRKKLPGALSRQLVRAAAVGCSKAEADERAAFYGPRLSTLEGASRGLAESLEAISLCTALREKSSNLKKALLGTPAPPRK
jgi:cytosol alanyl aminopeptidase